jgi:hypothetical protein
MQLQLFLMLQVQLNFNAVASQSEHPTFGGTLTNTVITDDAIRIRFFRTF